jgi:hypothetical protein
MAADSMGPTGRPRIQPRMARMRGRRGHQESRRIGRHRRRGVVRHQREPQQRRRTAPAFNPAARLSRNPTRTPPAASRHAHTRTRLPEGRSGPLTGTVEAFRARSRPSGHGPLPSPYIGRHGGACCLRAERMAGGVSAARASARSDRRLPQVTSRRTQPILNTAWPARGHRTALPYRSALQASVGHRVCVEAATCQVVRSWAGKGLPLPGCWSMMPSSKPPKGEAMMDDRQRLSDTEQLQILALLEAVNTEHSALRATRALAQLMRHLHVVGERIAGELSNPDRALKAVRRERGGPPGSGGQERHRSRSGLLAEAGEGSGGRSPGRPRSMEAASAAV